MSKTKYDLPKTVEIAVRAICGDYFRQKELLKHRELSDSVKLSCYTYSFTVYEATAHACGIVGCQAEEMILDIGEGRGYKQSALAGILTKSRYSRAKKRAIYSIAVRLYLIEGRQTPAKDQEDEYL